MLSPPNTITPQSVSSATAPAGFKVFLDGVERLQHSPGCDHCYALAIAESRRGLPAFPQGFDVTLRPHKLREPLKWRTPARVFVNSMSDLFHRCFGISRGTRRPGFR